MATIPLSGTNIRLLSGIPFSNDYKHTRYFENELSQNTYFYNKNLVHSLSEANFQRVEDQTFIRVNASIDELRNVNYVMFQNAHYNNKWFYGFVTKVQYIQKNTTYVHFQLDVYQTWMFELNFKPSFVIREHRPLWNADGSPVINTIDEGLNYGSAYETVSVDRYRPFNDVYFLVIVSKSAMHANLNEIRSTLNGSPQPLSYYVHPFKMDGSTPPMKMEGSEEGALISPPLKVMEALFIADEAVNNIVSLYVTDFVGVDIKWNATYNVYELPKDIFTNVTIDDPKSAGTFSTLYVKNLPSYNEKTAMFGNKYGSYKSVKESKLLMHPYTVLILDDLKGNRVELKNEYLEGDSLNISVRGSLSTSNKVAYVPTNYLSNDISTANKLYATLEHALINNNPNDLPILNDMLSAFLQGNRNSIENQKHSIYFNGAMNVLGGAATGAIGGGKTAVIGAAAGAVQGAGNTVLQIQGIEAKQQDINNTPPQMVKMGGNTGFDYGNQIDGLYIIRKQITEEYRKKLTDFFNQYGYKTNEVKIPNFHTRRYWNYVQTSSCIITGDFNNEDLNELKAIFDNGITLWHTDDIGNYSLENGVI